MRRLASLLAPRGNGDGDLTERKRRGEWRRDGRNANNAGGGGNGKDAKEQNKDKITSGRMLGLRGKGRRRGGIR